MLGWRWVYTNLWIRHDLTGSAGDMTLASLKLPKHVRVVKWAPQNDVLAHPGTKVFVTHGGANSVYEAAFHGIPIVALPIFAEQPHNAAKVRLETWKV